MTESVLKSIMRLFAILGNLRSSPDKAAENNDFQHTSEVVEAFLSQLVNPNKAHKYLQIFDFHFRNLQRKKVVLPIKRISLFSVKVLLICEQINYNIGYKQKAFVLLQLFDILRKPDNTLSEESMDFLNTIAESLDITANDYDLMFLFVYGSIKNKARNNEFLVVSGDSDSHSIRHHLYRENLSGSIVFFYHTTLQVYFFRHENLDDSLSLNGRQILFNRIYLLEKGYTIRCPKIQTIHFSDIASNFLHRVAHAEVQLIAQNIEFRFVNSENGIKRFNFTGKSGELIGIMGGSGVGKSTLLSILNGTLSPQKGNVYINSIDIYKDKDKAEGIIGFIPQDDFLIEELTVYENLYFSAKFCYSNDNEEQINERINILLKDLSLADISGLKVGSPLNKLISGGQRKRLNIALELLREPAILFVDEPTSGLSSSDSEKVMDLLKLQTYNGKLVVVNIHQPSSDIFKMIDRLLVLDKGGRPVYFGNTADSLSYFKNVTQRVNADENECIWCGNLNPEQLLEVIETYKVDKRGYEINERQITPDEWYQLYLNNVDSRVDNSPLDKPLPKSEYKTPDRLQQFILFLKRNVKCKLTDHQYLLVNLLEAPVLACILGFFTKHIGVNQNYTFSENLNIPAFIFMSVVVALFLGMMGSAEEIIRDAKQLKRETFLNLSRLSYINSKVVYLFFISAIQMLLYVVVSHFILEIKDIGLTYWLVLFSTSCFANIVGLNLSAGLESVVAIYIFIPLLIIPQLLLSGTIVKFDKLHPLLKSDINVPFIGDLMASRWAYEAITVAQFKDNKYESMLYNLEQTESNVTYCSNYWIPELINRVDKCSAMINKKAQNEKLEFELRIIRNEISKLAINMNITRFKNEAMLVPGKFDAQVAQKTSAYLRHARSVATKVLSIAIKERDGFTLRMSKKLGSEKKLIQLKQDYYNEALANQLLNKSESEQIVQVKSKLVRKYEPVFNTNVSKIGRAHYYSPVKKLWIFEIDSLLFNLGAIWFMSIILYIFLVFNVLGKLLRYI
jgi:ABC transport system ATP-binding/permease protein